MTVSSRRAFLAGLATMPLAGCIGTGVASTGAFTGSGSIREQALLNVITSRKPFGDATRPPFFDSARSSRLLYAVARINLPETSTMARLGALMTSDFSVKQVELKQGDAGQLLDEALRGRDSLMFVHGYNQSFQAAAQDAALLSDGIGYRGNTVVYSWPSKGGLLDYGYDRESALIARDQLAEGLAPVLGDSRSNKFNIVAHSMGTLVLMETLRSYHDRYGTAGFDRLGAIVLASPDIDIDVFKANLTRLNSLRSKITVITATNDRALGISRRLSGGERAGALPSSAFEGLGLKVADATEFGSGLVRHDAFLADPDVRAVIKRAIDRA